MSVHGALVEVEDPAVRFRTGGMLITAVAGRHAATEPCPEQHR